MTTHPLPAEAVEAAARARCQWCFGDGWVYDYLGGCGDPECCGGPFKIKCMACVNDWSPDNE